MSAELTRLLLHQMGYSSQAPSKQIERVSHPDRNAQFRSGRGAAALRGYAGLLAEVWDAKGLLTISTT